MMMWIGLYPIENSVLSKTIKRHKSFQNFQKKLLEPSTWHEYERKRYNGLTDFNGRLKILKYLYSDASIIPEYVKVLLKIWHFQNL